MHRVCSLVFVFALAGELAVAEKAALVLTDDDPKAVTGITKYIDATTGKIKSPSEAKALIDLVLGTNRFTSGAKALPKTDDADFYCIIHTVVWGAEEEAATPSGRSLPAQKVKSQNWYVFNGSPRWTLDQFTTGKRIYGAKNVALLYVYLNKDSDSKFQARYEVEVASKEPANVQNLFALAAAFLSARGEGPGRRELKLQNYAGIANFDVRWVPSDISVTPYLVQSVGREGFLRTGLADSVVFDNEGYYYWDASVGIPLRKMGQLEFVNANNTVTAKEPDKRTAFALLDLYPFRKDVKSRGFDWRPYAVAGVGVAKQPLHRILVGAGWGPRFAQFYAGVLFVKEQELQGIAAGSAATPAQQAAATDMRYHRKFAFGINLPVREVFKATTGGK